MQTPAGGEREMQVPEQGAGRASYRTEPVLLVCFYDPRGIATVQETVAHLQLDSAFPVTVLNLFEHRLDTGFLRLSPWLRLDQFDAVIIHNTVSYDVDNLRSLDASLAVKLRDWDGVKVLMKQDENYRFRETAQYIGETGFDLVYTCLPPEAVPLVYPPDVVGPVRFERMLTGYVTPTLRARDPLAGPRPIDIGYRGSIQPLSFGRLAYEKRSIGARVAAQLAGRTDLALDISSRWEDRLGGGAWLDFLGSSKATLGAESGASIFDLAGDLDERCAQLQARHAHLPGQADRDEAVLAGLADLEHNVRYGQLSPRHFEAIACGAAQLLYPGIYSNLLQAGRHYFVLERDLSNLDAAVEFVRDEPRRRELVQLAFDEVIRSPCNWIEAFVARVDGFLDEALRAKGRRRSPELLAGPARHVVVLGGADLPLPAVGDTLRWHRVVPGDTATGPQLRAEEQVLTLPSVPWSKAGAACLQPLLAQPAALAAWQELLLAEHLLGLEEAQLCAALGLPPGMGAADALRARLRAMLAGAGAATAAATGLRGVRAVLVRDVTQLAAGLLLKGLLRIPLLVVPTQELLPPGALEGEAAWWRAALARVAPLVDGGTEDAARAAVPPDHEPLTWIAPRAAACYVAPPPPPVPQAPPAALEPLRRLWHLLPAPLRRQLFILRVRARGHRS